MSRPTDSHRPGDRPLTSIRDVRRRDTGTFEPRRGGEVEQAGKARAGPGPQPQVEALRAELRERTADLQRLQADYDNYRKRVRRDRLAVGEIAVANVLSGLLPVLDAVDRAHQHGEVTGGFQRVVELLESRLAALGLQPVGMAGDPFDPAVHEALWVTHTDQVDRPTCTAILRPGYRVGDQLLRPAQAEVAEPLPAP